MIGELSPDERREAVDRIIESLPEEDRRFTAEDQILLDNLQLLRQTVYKEADFSAYKR